MKKNRVDIVNLGCRLNIFEGEVINALVKKSDIKNYTIINSCAVTEQAEKKVLYEIRKSKKYSPDKKIIVTGCAAQINPKKYAGMLKNLLENDVEVILERGSLYINIVNDEAIMTGPAEISFYGSLDY